MTDGPSTAELQEAGVCAHVDRIRAQAEAEFGRTRFSFTSFTAWTNWDKDTDR